MDEETLLQFDREHIWHPYTSFTTPLPVYLVESAAGCKIKLKNGQELIDGMSSWWSVIHGYSHPVLVDAIQSQAEKLSHVMFGGLTHEPAINLCKKLVDITPDGLEKVFLCDSGSISVEVAMKMAIQYYYAQGKNGKNRFLTIRSGYHGDAFHAMSVCDPVTGMHSLYKGVLPEYYFADKPETAFSRQWNDSDFESFRKLIDEHHSRICAVILEPVVQGAGGMRFYHPQYLKEVRKCCDEYGILLILDEIATGFGRSGKFFACEHAAVRPDIMCIGKALTGGYMTLAAVIATKNVAEVISNGNPGVFMHGPTFMGNPLACSVANSSIELLLENGWQEQIAHIERQMKTGLEECRSYPGVADVRCLGGIGVVELEQPVTMGEIQKSFVAQGVWVRPFGKLVYIMPPYVISDIELDQLLHALRVVIKAEGLRNA